MEPIIGNYRSLFKAGGPTVRLIPPADNPPTCTMNYSVVEPGKTSAHHIHPWEHEVFILEGSGVLVCDGKEFPVSEGDAALVPSNAQHQWRSNNCHRAKWLVINPLSPEGRG